MPAQNQERKRHSYSRTKARFRTRRENKEGRRWYWLLVAFVWLLIWQILYLLVQQDLLLASPLQVFLSLARLCTQLDFWLAALFSLLRIESGFLLGVIAGTIFAVLTVRFVWIDRFVYPAISAIRSTPIASFIILALVWMSSGKVVIFIVFLMVLPIVWANVTEGIRKIDPQLLEMAAVFQLNRRQIFRYIDIPSVSPFFIAAATTGLGLAWKAGIAAEVLSTPPHSLGGGLYEAKIYLETPELLAYTAVIVILSLLLEKLLVRVLHNTGRYFQHHGRTEIPGSMADKAAGKPSETTTDKKQSNSGVQTK